MYDLTKGCRKVFLAQIILLFVFVLLTLLSTFMTKVVVDSFTGDIVYPDKQGIIGMFVISLLGGTDFILNNQWILAVGVVVFAVLLAITNIIRMTLVGKIDSTISVNAKLKLFYHIERLPYEFLKTRKNGDLLQVCMRDETVLRNFIVQRFIATTYTLFIFICSFTILMLTNWVIAVSTIVLVPFLFIQAYYTMKKVKKLYRKVDESESIVTDKIDDSLNSIRLIKAYNNEQKELEAFDKSLDDYSSKFLKWAHVRALFAGTNDLFIFAEVILVEIVAIYLTLTGVISLGTLAISTTFATLIVWPIRDTASSLTEYARAQVSVDRMNELFDCPKEDIDSGKTPIIAGKIEFKNAKYMFSDDNKYFLNGLNLIIQPGETIAIMGRTGSGKSTLAHLLTRLYEVSDGDIFIDDINIKDISKKHLRNNISTVLQEPFLFSRSVHDNLKIMNNNIELEEIYKATNITQVHSSITEFAEGYQTQIGEKGITLSGGQKQRLAMARTILKNSPIIIFDDSLSAVDAKTDLMIRTSLKNHKKEATTIIITQRSITAKDADKIVVLDNGVISELGTHEQLLQNNKLYAKVYKAQSRI